MLTLLPSSLNDLEERGNFIIFDSWTETKIHLLYDFTSLITNHKFVCPAHSEAKQHWYVRV